MSTRWFVLPVASDTDAAGTTTRTPKYVGRGGAYESDIDGWAGSPIDWTQWSDPPWDAELYAVHVRAATATLDAIEAEADADTRQEHGISTADAAAWLNAHYPADTDRSFDEWTAFFTGG